MIRIGIIGNDPCIFDPEIVFNNFQGEYKLSNIVRNSPLEIADDCKNEDLILYCVDFSKEAEGEYKLIEKTIGDLLVLSESRPNKKIILATKKNSSAIEKQIENNALKNVTLFTTEEPASWESARKLFEDSQILEKIKCAIRDAIHHATLAAKNKKLDENLLALLNKKLSQLDPPEEYCQTEQLKICSEVVDWIITLLKSNKLDDNEACNYINVLNKNFSPYAKIITMIISIINYTDNLQNAINLLDDSSIYEHPLKEKLQQLDKDIKRLPQSKQKKISLETCSLVKKLTNPDLNPEQKGEAIQAFLDNCKTELNEEYPSIMKTILAVAATAVVSVIASFVSFSVGFVLGGPMIGLLAGFAAGATTALTVGSAVGLTFFKAPVTKTVEDVHEKALKCI